MTEPTPPDRQSLERVIRTLEERAKELNCLYQVEQAIASGTNSLDEIMEQVVQALPAAMQFPDICAARIQVRGRSFATAGFEETLWKLSSPIRVSRTVVGSVTVSYLQPRPRYDEGSFLKEELKLLEMVADRLGQAILQRQLKAAFEERRQPSEDRYSGWRTVLELLLRTDRGLVRKISRKMINHLFCLGFEEAKSLLGQMAAARDDATDLFEDNQPLRRGQDLGAPRLVEETFQIAANRLDSDEIFHLLQIWIQEDKLSFLFEVLERPYTTQADLATALDRFRQCQIEPRDLSQATQATVRVSLIRRLFTDDLEFLNAARKYLEISDFQELLQRVVLLPDSHGKLGGKSSGLLLAEKIIARAETDRALLGAIKVPKTWYIPSDALLMFIHNNDLEDVYNWKYLEIEQIRQGYPHIVQVFKDSRFPPEIVQALSLVLDDFAGRPVIVRSSSLLEDRGGAAFAGKYKSLFLANQGTKAECLEALLDAIAEVYASIFGPDPIEYRAERGLLDHHEEMGIMLQEVIGTRVGPYFLPAYAGVAFSNNEFRWSPRIRRKDGLLRLVPGLGTRAVDRVGDDFPVLLAPGQPALRANVSPDEVVRYSPKKLDVLNLTTRSFETIEAATFLHQYYDELPWLRELVSIYDGDRIRRPNLLGIDFEREEACFTFEGLIGNGEFVPRIAALLNVLREKLGTPVDIEFASDGRDFYLLQCRPQSNAGDAGAATIPREPHPERVVFTASRHVSNGRVPDITHIVYVSPEGYDNLPDLQQLRQVGRAVGRLNKLLPKRQFILMGPGRWGSRGDIKLGVNVTYSDINNAAMLVEIARKKGNYVPDLSFGTHFFQDLVEASIRYLPLFPDDAGVIFNESFLSHSSNILPELLPEFSELREVVRVIDVPSVAQGMILRILLNAELDQAMALLTSPEPLAPVSLTSRTPSPLPVSRSSCDDHWQWRLRMAQRLASQLDPVRFGVEAVYLIGSTKNASADPSSDIDLLVHVRGTAAQRRELELWLEGWSRCLAELNFQRTGFRLDRLLDVRFLEDEDLTRQTSFASKIGAVTDPARPLLIGTPA